MAIEGFEYGLEGECHIGAGIAVGNRKNVDAVDVITPLKQVPDAGAKRARHALPVQVSNRNRSFFHELPDYRSRVPNPSAFSTRALFFLRLKPNPIRSS